MAAREKAQREGGRRRPFCYGRWKRRIDYKRRVCFPARFRGRFGREIVIVEKSDLKGFLVYPIDGICELGDYSKVSKVWIVMVDGQGRIAIPPVISFSQPELFWLGKGDHFEVVFG